MDIRFGVDASETIVFAAAELEAYLRRMLTESVTDWEVELISGEDVFVDAEKNRCATQEEHCGTKADRSADQEKRGNTANDCFRVEIGEAGGFIAANNDRSVLLAVYDYLHYLGCRFLMPRRECEIVPVIGREALPAKYKKQASYYHRGVCIEGADSLENIQDYIDWLPKVGFNSFFLQFKSPYAFLKRWYAHLENPYAEAEDYAPEDAVRDMALLEHECKKRGLLLHKAGHGWTGEVLGYQTVSWETQENGQEERFRHRMAMIGGERKLFMGIPADTNLCYHNADAAEAFVELVTAYAKDNPRIDYLHVWLADEYNNLCECPDCSRTTLADQYVALLNEIDRRLAAAGLATRIVFLLYQELLWPPVVNRLVNPDRFVLMFAPISRTFEKSYELGMQETKIPAFHRNQVTLPASLAENMAFLKGWRRIFPGDSFVYDYPLGRAHYGDFGYVHIARVLHEDIRKLDGMGLNGYISCQELRAALPNALPNYVMGRTLFDRETPFEAMVTEYFQAAYGAEGEKSGDDAFVRECGGGRAAEGTLAAGAREVLTYLTELSELGSCDYVNGKGERTDSDMAARMAHVRARCEAFGEVLLRRQNTDGGYENIYWELLEYHRNYVMRFAAALGFLAAGDSTRAGGEWEALREYICRNEPKYQPYLDVYRVLEVTQKYTKLQSNIDGTANQKGEDMRHQYYYYDREELLRKPKLPIAVLADNEAVFREMAQEMADEIKRKNMLGEKTVLICPVGPVGQYPYFVEIVNREGISLRDVWFFNMDEYLTDDKEWIDKNDPLSFRGFMDREVYQKIRSELVMPKEQRVFPDPHDPEAMTRLVERLGGVDICFGGIGINGHLAFNEADDAMSVEEFKGLHTRVLKISRETRTTNAIGDLDGAIDDMPRFCVTIGMHEIYHARKVRLGCFRDWHRSVVRHAAYGEVSAHFPATLLQEHPDALLRITEFVANLRT